MDQSNKTASTSSKPVLHDAPPAKPGHEEVEASDSGKPWILGMAAAVMMVVGLVIGSVLFSAPKMKQHVEPFLLALNAQDYDKAYSLVAPEWRAAMPREKFNAYYTKLQSTLGNYKSMKQVDAEELEHPLMGVIDRVYFEAVYEKGKVKLMATMRETKQGWSLLSMYYESPLIQIPVEPAVKKPAARRPEAPRPAPAAPVVPMAPAPATPAPVTPAAP